MRLIVLLTFAGCLGAAMPSSADAKPAESERATPDPTEIRTERVVCEKITRIGTRIPQRVCRTESQIRAEREAAGKWTSRKQEEAARSGGLPPDVGPG